MGHPELQENNLLVFAKSVNKESYICQVKILNQIKPKLITSTNFTTNKLKIYLPF